MTRLEEAACRIHEIFWRNCGDNDDWALRILCDDDLEAEFVDAMNELGNAVEQVKPGSKPWPLQSL